MGVVAPVDVDNPQGTRHLHAHPSATPARPLPGAVTVENSRQQFALSTHSNVRRARRVSLIAVVSLLGSAFHPKDADAATYYVSPSGSNSNPGTLAAPFATLQKAHDVAVAGDTIWVRGGTYTPSAQTTPDLLT